MLASLDWQSFARDGYLHLGQVLTEAEVLALKQRADDLALGRRENPDVQMQMDTGGEYESLPGAVPRFETGTLLYRKIQGLENDDLFLKLIKQPLFREVCGRVYGPHAPVSIFRAMVMNKPAGQGTLLPWHQDGGNVWALDRDPLVTIWVALDPATEENGCMDCIPGSHTLGLLSLFGSTVSPENVQLHCPPEKARPLPVPAGHAVLLHNWLIHRSGVNPSSIPRRAFTMCCLDGRTRSTLTGALFPMVWGELPEGVDQFMTQAMKERTTLQENARDAGQYAQSLAADNQALRTMREDAEKYAQSMEVEVKRLQAENATLRTMREAAEKYALSLEADRAHLRQVMEAQSQVKNPAVAP
jgi:phytanoyl-CoA hydroxylase